MKNKIVDYILGYLSVEEKMEFENQMQDDPGLTSLFIEYKNIIDALKQKYMLDDWNNVKRIFKIKRYLQFFGIVAIGIITLLFTKNYIVSKGKKSMINETNNISKNKIDTTNFKTDTAIALSKSNISAEANTLKVINAPSAPTLSKYSFTRIFDSAKNTTAPYQIAFQNWEMPKTTVQKFIINVNRDTTLICAGGLKIFLPQKTIPALDQTHFAMVKVTEIIDYIDFFKNNMHSQSNGKLLESGGCCKIEIYNLANEIQQLKPLKAFTLYFPNPNIQNNMHTFYGKDSANNFNWNAAKKAEKLTDDCNCDLEKINNKKYNVQFENKCENRMDINHFFDTNKLSIDYFNLLNNIPIKLTKKIFPEENDSMWLHFTLNDKNEFSNFYYEYKNRRPCKRIRKFSKYIKNYAFMNPSPSFEIPNVLCKEILCKFTLVDKAMDVIDKKYFGIVSNNFGWINCDRFAGRTGPKVTVQLPKNDSVIQSQLFFTTSKTVLNSVINEQKILFKNIPALEPCIYLQLIKTNGKVYYQFAKGMAKDKFNLSELKEFNIEEIESVLNKTNKIQ